MRKLRTQRRRSEFLALTHHSKSVNRLDHLVNLARTVVLRAGSPRLFLYADFPYPLNAHPTALVAKNSEADLALLAVDVSISGATQKTTINVREGMEVFVVGFDDQHTEKDNPQIQSGVITTVGWWEDRGYHLFTSRRTTLSGPLALLISGSNCQPGKSGSPVFEADGKILAVTTSFTHNHSCLATAIPALVDLLEQMEPFE